MCIRDSSSTAEAKSGAEFVNWTDEKGSPVSDKETIDYTLKFPEPVSYTHLDVYKRQIFRDVLQYIMYEGARLRGLELRRAARLCAQAVAEEVGKAAGGVF